MKDKPNIFESCIECVHVSNQNYFRGELKSYQDKVINEIFNQAPSTYTAKQFAEYLRD